MSANGLFGILLFSFLDLALSVSMSGIDSLAPHQFQALLVSWSLQMSANKLLKIMLSSSIDLALFASMSGNGSLIPHHHMSYEIMIMI